MSDIFTAYWTNFARSGNPNIGGATAGIEWPRFNSSVGAHVVIDAQQRVDRDPFSIECSFWDAVYERQQLAFAQHSA